MSNLNPGLLAATRAVRTLMSTNTRDRSSESLMALNEALSAIGDVMEDDGARCSHEPWFDCSCNSEEATL